MRNSEKGTYIKNPEKVVRIATIFTLLFMVCWGLISVFTEIRPFWVDEWRIMYNLKFKSAAQLWGPLDFMQQFPRVYMQVIKAYTAPFNYSYRALRLPSYIVGLFTMALCYRLMNKIFKPGHINKFLFVMVLVSCSTFTVYYVEIKQYTMDMLLSVVAIWQFMELSDFIDTKTLSITKYLVLCLSFLIVPFFSYIYPIAIAPAFIIVFIRTIHFLKTPGNKSKLGFLLQLWFPLCLCAVSIVVFYLVDVSQLLADKGMRQYWGHLLLDNGFSWNFFFYTIYNLFAEIGSGLIYWILFGILGSAAFLYSIYRCAHSLLQKQNDNYGWLRLYSVLLLILVFTLFLTKKLPVGEPRLNAFTIPSVSILIIYLLDELKRKRMSNKISWGITVILYVGLIGNIYTTFFAAITGPAYAKEMNIYTSTQKAIILAQLKKIPILITAGVAYPYENTINFPYANTIPGDWVLKSFPAYNVADSIAVYPINDLNTAIINLPENITYAILGDGISFQVIKR